MTPSALEALRTLLFEAYAAGFAASAEGFNGEFPFDGVVGEIKAHVDVGAGFQQWLDEAST